MIECFSKKGVAMEKVKKILLSLSLLILVGLVIIMFLLIGSQQTSLGEQVAFDAFKTGKILQSEQVLGEVARSIPTTLQNEGKNLRYPIYDHTISDLTDEEKSKILQEDSLLRASDQTYDSMDQYGNLYLNGTATGKKLYKHTASEGMYLGDVSDSEPAVVQKITINAIEERNYITGLYAPAGEVVKIEITEHDLQAIGGELLVCVGQVSHRNINNNIWAEREFNRMPNLGNKMTITTTTAYVGNYLGGPIYVYPKNFNVKFSVTISGAVRYPHYIHGYTTKQELEQMQSLSAPYFDFEISDLGVRHSGPKKTVSLNYDNFVKVGNLWEKICRTSRQVPCSANASIGVGFVYDCFVAAGAACVFQGGHSWINAPYSWLASALDYQTMTQDGFWGQIHEFNHLYQSYGMYDTKTNEVTNNATSLLSYVLYTQISSKRSESDATLGNDWNRYTDPTRSLRETISNEQSGDAQFALNAYADLIHSFGTDVFSYATRIQTKLGVDYWYEALSKATGYNMTYYFEQVLHHTISDQMKALYNTPTAKTFVPVACLYQTGRYNIIGGEEQHVQTVQPFEIEKGQEFTLDFSEHVYVPKEYTYRIKKITQPKHGSIIRTSDFVYKYVPSQNEYSGTFNVTIELLSNGNAVQDVTLSINLKQRVKNVLNVTKYTYSSALYSDVNQALEANFAGYESVSQSQSTTTFLNGINNNQIGIVQGKIYIEQDGEYAICLRSGRGNNTLYLSINNANNLTQVLSLTGNHPNFALEGEHVTKLNLSAGDYLYFKEITLSTSYDAYTELGIANLTTEQEMAKVSSKVLYNDNVFKSEYSFTTPEKYVRKYTTQVPLGGSNLAKQSLYSINFSRWDATTDIQNMFDESLESYYHNERDVFVSQENPFELVVNLGEVVTCNTIVLSARTSNKENLPCSFKLYGGLDVNNMVLLGEYTNLAMNNKKISATFNKASIQFYKLSVTDTKATGGGNKYVSFARIDFYNNFSGEEKSPFMLNYYKNKTVGNSTFRAEREDSTFGHIVKGNGFVTYTFTGSQIAMFAKQESECKIKITINNKSQTLTLNASGQKELFLCEYLTQGTHALLIEVLHGTLAIDSFIVA